MNIAIGSNIPSSTLPSNTQSLINRDDSLEELGEKLGEFRAYSNDLPITEIVGTRIVKCSYQVNKNTGKKAGDNSYVRIPTKHLTEQVVIAEIAKLAPYVLGYLQEQENKMIKADHKKGSMRVYTEYLDLDKIIAALEESEQGARITKDQIEAWFTTEMEEMLAMLVSDKMGISASDAIDAEQEAKLLDILYAYKVKFTELTSTKAILKDSDRVALVNVITKCEADKSVIGSRLIARIDRMSTTISDELEAL